ncbi:MAG: amidohydrolase family protein [Acidobacteria bacterium]|nr:amidohydrolase family protein [Acidobacteriota bacterium]
MRRILRTWTCLFIGAPLVAVAACSSSVENQTPTGAATVFEGARLITGDGGAPIENSAFIVENGQVTGVGRRGTLSVPPGARRVDLTGKTVMPAMVDLHGHIGFQNVPAGSMSKDMYTRENLIDHLERLAYHGISGVVSIADLMDRSDLRGGRTQWGDVPLRVRNDIIPGAALFRTAGPGIAWPGSGAQGHPSRADVPYPVTTVEEAREAVADYARMKPEFIKIWVDDRDGRAKKLTPPIYRAIIEEAHKNDISVAAHNVTLADAKELVRAGVEGWTHVPVRGGDVVDEELLALVRARVANNNRPTAAGSPPRTPARRGAMWMTTGLRPAWMNSTGGGRPDWLDDPLLNETYPPQHNKEHLADELARLTPAQVEEARRELERDGRNAMRLRAAGIRIVLGTDTGQIRHRIGYFAHLELEALVAIGMTPAEAIAAATRDAADIAQMNTGLVAAGRSADFIVLDANPLEDISNTRRIADVYLRGRPVDRAGLRARWRSSADRR